MHLAPRPTRRFAALIPLAAATSLLALAACNDMMMKHDTMAMQPSLYQRLGGKPAIVAVVDDFVGNVAADKRINAFFSHTNIPHLKGELVDQICSASGGPCVYTGKSMKAAHEGRGISSADFNALVEDLQTTLNKFKVPAKEQGELLGVLGPMKPDIVEKM